MTWIESHLGDWVVRHRWLVIFLTIPTIAIAATGIRHIKICNDTRVFFTEENPDYQTLKALELTYSKEQSIFLVVAPKDGNVFTRQTLAAMSELTDAGWRIPHAIRVNSPTNFPHTRVEGDDLIVENLVRDPNSLTDAQLDEVRQIALSETAMVNRLISPRGHVAGIYIAFITPPEDTQAETQAAEGARQVADGFRARHPDIDLYLTGSVMIDHAFAQASRSDMMTLIPTACLVMTVLVGISLRSFYGTFAAVVVTILSMITALGLTGWLGVPLNAVTVGAPGLMLTLAVADNVHVLTTMFHRVRQGDSKHAAIAKSMQVNLKAIFLTNVTTIIGFLSMNFSDSPPFRDMGNLVGTGVAVDLVNSILLLPALMAVLPVHIHPRRERAPWIDMNRVADFVIRRRRSLLASMLVLTALASTGILRIELDDNFLTYFDDTFEFRRATDFLTKNLTGWDVIEYSLGSGQSGGITDPEYLAVVDRFADWYRRQPKVVHVSAITDTMKRLNQDMHGGDAGYYRIPDQRELAAQYLLFYELSLPFGTDLNGQIDVDKSAARFTVVLQSMSAKELSRMEAVARRWLDTNAPACMHADATGLSLIWARITQRNIGSML
ncbi:MAG: hypothetical protein A2Y77_11325, partial [Planctomycetes bacterium RBG_13_62_9]